MALMLSYVSSISIFSSPLYCDKRFSSRSLLVDFDYAGKSVVFTFRDFRFEGSPPRKKSFSTQVLSLYESLLKG